ncbi:uncharacterized protein LOC108670610 [Hyalella azteca]|uniref:Uncharacterized protein LOC108670610 n=1 Tax=Hyalella azteca TaxID=294128 RepID=A0A979FJL3_HYAAZ|nr:uncharacterized protein LOC108670610 [Hyalella azteca]
MGKALLLLLQLSLARAASLVAPVPDDASSGAEIPELLSLGVAVGGRWGQLVSGKTVGPFTVGSNVNLTCFLEYPSLDVTELRWLHNKSLVEDQEEDIYEDAVATTMQITNMTMKDNGRSFSCRYGFLRERHVFLLVITAGSSDDTHSRASMPVIMLFAFILVLPIIVMFMRAREGAVTI